MMKTAPNCRVLPRWAAVVALLAGQASAQELPQFDESLGFEVRGVIDGSALIVQNGANAFYCDTDDGPNFSYLALSECIPIVGRQAALDAERAAASAADAERAFITELAAKPAAEFSGAIARTMRQFGCALDFDKDEDAFVAALARSVADDAGYYGSLSKDTVDQVGRVTSDAAEQMVESGQIMINDTTGTARLVGCQ